MPCGFLWWPGVDTVHREGERWEGAETFVFLFGTGLLLCLIVPLQQKEQGWMNWEGSPAWSQLMQGT